MIETAATTDAPQPARRTLYAAYGMGLLGISLLDLYAMLVPLYAVSLGASSTEVGLLLGARSFLPAFFSIHGGSLMDRLGTRRVLLGSTLLVGGLALVFPATPWFPALMLAQLFSGLFITFNWIGAQTLVAQIAYGDPVPLGRFNFICRFGTIGAPLIAGALWDMGGPWPTFGMVAVCATIMHILVRIVPEPNPELARRSRPPITELLPRVSDYTRSFALMLIPVIAFTMVVSGLRNSATSIQNSIYIVYLQGIGVDGTAVGLLFAILEVTVGLASLNVGPLRRLGHPEVVLLITTAASIALIAVTPLLGGIFALLLLMQALRGAAQGFMQPLMFSIQSEAAGKDFQGAVVGLRATANRLFSVTLPPIMGFIADSVSLEASFILTGAFLILGCVALGWLIVARPSFRLERNP